MSAPNEQTQTYTKSRDIIDISKQIGIDLGVQADTLLDEAREADSEQSSLIDTSPLDSQYNAALAAQVDAKHDQAERIEDRLENLIEIQASRLQQVQTQQPGFWALPGTRQMWQQQMQQQQNTMQKLRGRLEVVREIKEGMGVHSPRIEELAAHKLRFQEPGLTSQWIDMQEAHRRHQALLRKMEQDKKKLLIQRRERTSWPGCVSWIVSVVIFFNNGVLSYLKPSPVTEILRPCGGFAQMRHTIRQQSFSDRH